MLAQSAPTLRPVRGRWQKGKAQNIGSCWNLYLPNPRKGVLGSYQQTADFEPRRFKCVQKLPLQDDEWQT